MSSKPIKYSDRTEWRNEAEQLHREDGPAIEYANGGKSWYKEGKLHRLDGPACEGTDGSKSWYKEDKLHRDDGPAIERADGSKFWYKEGKRHRLDGPAIEWADGSKEWYIDGVKLTEEEFNKEVEKVSIMIYIAIDQNQNIDPSFLQNIKEGFEYIFHYISGTSNKFWSIAFKGLSFTTHWGRLGTIGQSKTKNYIYANIVRKTVKKLIVSKLSKGYKLMEVRYVSGHLTTQKEQDAKPVNDTPLVYKQKDKKKKDNSLTKNKHCENSIQARISSIFDELSALEE